MRSNSKLPLVALGLTALALLAWATAAAYTLRVNPEIRVYRTAFATKLKWARRLDAQFTNKFVVCGGSSCATSIMGRRMLEQHQVPVVNFGFHAGMGAAVIVRGALAQTRPGDSLILALEPGLLEMKAEVPLLGQQFAVATGHPEFLGRTDLASRMAALLSLRPGGYHFFTLLGKVALRQPLYRYQAEDFDESGYQRVEVRREFAAPSERTLVVSEPARKLFLQARDECSRRNVRLAYTLPWIYCPKKQVAAAQQFNRDFLMQVSELVPVLVDEKLGAYSLREQFADTDAHLTPAGAALRTDSFAALISTWKTWSTDDLARLSFGDR